MCITHTDICVFALFDYRCLLTNNHVKFDHKRKSNFLDLSFLFLEIKDVHYDFFFLEKRKRFVNFCSATRLDS